MTITKKICPNFDGKSYRKPIDRIVIHWFGIGTLQSADTRFQNPDAKASAHYGISDDTVYQWVEEENVAWHAGVYTMNQRSIGIEHDATTTKDATEKTYQTSGHLVREIAQRYNIPLDREHIIGHKEVSATQCPGTLDLDKIIAIAKGERDTYSIDEDIPSELEDRFLLKEITYYSKYWTLSDLINDWKAACKDRDSLSALKSSYKELEKRYVKELSEKQEHIESLQKTLSETNLNLATVTENYSKTTLENKNLVDDIEEMKKINADDLVLIGNLQDTINEHENEIEKLENELELKLNKIPRIKLFWSFIFR